MRHWAGQLFTDPISIEVIMNSTKSIFRSSVANTVCRALFLLAVALPVAIPVALTAQTAGQGTISGTVTDSTGAVVPGAKVIATNTATNVSSERTSSSAGLYTIAPLPPGTYSVSVQAPG